MAEFARHMAPDAAGCEGCPGEGNYQGRKEVNETGKADMDNSDHPPQLVGPVQAVAEFKKQEAETGEDGEVMPDMEIEEGYLKNKSAKKNSGDTHVACSQEDVQHPHPGGAAIFVIRATGCRVHGVMVLFDIQYSFTISAIK
jgi:hypothetical protein